MSDALVPVITRAGLAAVIRAQNNGLQAEISHIAIGRGRASGALRVGYVPTKTQTALMAEANRVPLLSGARLDPVGFRVLARVPASMLPTEYVVQEVGVFLSDGTLFAVWSSPSFPLTYRAGLADLDLALDLYLEQVPVEALTLVVQEPDVPETAGVLARLLSISARTFIADIAHERRSAARGVY